ncbi:Phosphoribosylformylglycinamidine synthase, PurS subunit [Alkalibacterium sp. AK22]|uniref:phosphoribosylformylglycinamidine synthase subunit PurS n=1 Tax=Alkalibacterium sp. AK22 TaxID=1229520 RepID=UPI0004483A9F|nr:phosphoribosylformylglycinamidine synthase subunit PurS [Alkalibacterium sp. AK22]EXJ23972.1 Phosphoribosylformylglycinamidine synthase, PurS subunit [Alkalibacterium sp. AK22]
MYNVKVYVTYKESILDPQGEAVRGAVHRMGFEEIDSVRMGKYFEIKVQNHDERSVEEVIETVCDKLLANVVMESYRYEIEKVKETV